MTRVRRVLRLAALVALLAGCGSVAIERPWTPEELKARCERSGGWWRGGAVGAFCEFQSPGLI